jgi:hypothetical protein
MNLTALDRLTSFGGYCPCVTGLDIKWDCSCPFSFCMNVRKVCWIADRGTHVCRAVIIVSSILLISGRLLPTLYRNSNTHACVPGKKSWWLRFEPLSLGLLSRDAVVSVSDGYYACIVRFRDIMRGYTHILSRLEIHLLLLNPTLHLYFTQSHFSLAWAPGRALTCCSTYLKLSLSLNWNLLFSNHKMPCDVL